MPEKTRDRATIDLITSPLVHPFDHQLSDGLFNPTIKIKSRSCPSVSGNM